MLEGISSSSLKVEEESGAAHAFWAVSDTV